MVPVRAAWASPEALWDFLTSPDEGVKERRVAASKAGQIIPLDWLPRVIQARRQLQHERVLHNFGLADNPMSAYTPFRFDKTPRDRIGAQTTRMILGHPFVVPEKRIEYPPTDDDLKRAWPAQVSTAMDALYWGLVQHHPPDEVQSIALKLPCTNYETAHQIVELTVLAARGRRSVPPEVFGTWLNILRGNSDVNRASIGILGGLDIVVTRQDNTWAMTQVFGLEALKTQDTSIIYPAIDAIRHFRPTPYTFALAAARYLTSSRDQPFNRAYEGDVLLRAIGEPPLGAPTAYDEKNRAEYERHAARFADWLKDNEARLDEKANAEKPLIENAREKMSVATACRR